MRHCATFRNLYVLTAVLLTIVVFASACQQPATTNNSNTNVNTTSTNTNTNTSTTSTNANTPPVTGTTIEAREPDKYSATITLRIEAQGATQTTTTPPLAADFVKNGADRRVSFKIGSEQVIFLDSGTKRYIIAPNRKQYAELTQESTGFNVPTTMTPGEIINNVKGMSGCERQAEEQLNGRTATKYRCAGKTSTGTQAGEVSNETFVFIDKETGLPLRSESLLGASGSVKGISGLKVVTELTNIKTEIDTALFAEPQGMSKVAPEQVKQQVNLVLQAVLAIAGQMMNNASAPATGSASPAATASPSASPAR